MIREVLLGKANMNYQYYETHSVRNNMITLLCAKCSIILGTDTMV
jgi:hypothetical protein